MNSKSLYIHVPFCVRKCLFCSFVVAIAQEHRADDYVQALIKEAAPYAGMTLETIYLGGGTPSLLPTENLEQLMQFVYRHFDVRNCDEVTIEANPETITTDKIKCFKDLGFNRISLGVQTLNERYLKFLGRNHNAETALKAFEMLHDAGFKNINVDLMYGFPKQTTDEITDDVKRIAALGSQHMSLYTLTIEPKSRMHAQHLKLDDDQILGSHYEHIAHVLEEFGFKQYEISNFAKPTFESKHNSNYWQGKEYIGLGVGAHGYFNGRRYWNVERLIEYIEKIQSQGAAIEGDEQLSPETQIIEKLLFGLRTNAGVDVNLIPSSKKALINEFIQDGFFMEEGNRLKATAQGRLVLDELSVRLI